MTMAEAKMVVEKFYKYFNALDFDKLFSLVSEDIAHEVNYDGVMTGKDEFIKYMKDSIELYQENVGNCVYMISDDGRNVTVKFIVNGKYIKTDKTMIPAKGQKYVLTVFNYFEIENNKIVKAQCFYDEKDMASQLKQTGD